MIECPICRQPFLIISGMVRHVTKTHRISSEELYLKSKGLAAPPTCKACGKPVRFINFVKGYREYCSSKCCNNSIEFKTKSANTCMEKYGCRSSMQSKEIQEKSRQTCLKKYGVEFPSQNKDIRTKQEQTCLNKYGVNNPINNDKIRKKAQETCKEKFGFKTPFENPEIQKDIKNTFINKFGVDNPFKAEKVKEKIRSTNIKRYGTEVSASSEVVKEKIKHTFITKYGGHPIYNKEIMARSKKRYVYNGIGFDSSWELAFYIYHSDNNANIIPHPKTFFLYSYNNEQHRYYPDFKLNEEFYEIKGPQFFNNANELVNPFRPSDNPIWKCKLQCMNDNNVKIISNCEFYIDYVNKKYGKNYLSSFKNI